VRYEIPDTTADAARLLSEEEGVIRILAGGTDVIAQLNAGFVEPDLVVDIKRLPGFRDITAENGGYRIGAAVPCAEMSEHPGLKALWPGVVEAAAMIGSTQIQGRATIVGNLCNGSPAADSVPALVAADAVATIIGLDGRRELPVAEVPIGPGRTVLDRSEILESIFLPARPARSADAYQRFTPRTEMDIAVVGVGVSLTLDEGGTCTAARLALGAVAETVILVPEAAAILIGSTLDTTRMDELARAASDACRPVDDKRGTIEFRTKVAGVLARRVTELAFERARCKS
jgi:CO/xanthine dehydrogenase FAD-binding subunit